MSRFRQSLSESTLNRPLVLAVPLGLVVVLLVVIGVSGFGGDGDNNEPAVVAFGTPGLDVPPSATPRATNTPPPTRPSASPTPTEEAEPSPTAETVAPANTGPEPTATTPPVVEVAPTDTPVPVVPTATPVPPTNTPLPTETPLPTATTPPPTNTPQPTATQALPPQFTVNPAYLTPGQTVTLTVRNFPPNAVLSVRVCLGALCESVATGETTDANGNADGSFPLAQCANPQPQQGVYNITVHALANGQQIASQSVTFDNTGCPD